VTDATGTQEDPAPSGPIQPIACKCGADVTKLMRRLDVKITREFRRMHEDDRNAVCRHYRISTDGFDIVSLAENDLVLGDCGKGDCKGTVQILGRCYKGSAVNYWLFGRLTKLCGHSERVNRRLALGYRKMMDAKDHITQPAADSDGIGAVLLAAEALGSPLPKGSRDKLAWYETGLARHALPDEQEQLSNLVGGLAFRRRVV